MIESYHFLLESPRARRAVQAIGFLVLALLLVYLSLEGELDQFLMAVFGVIGALFFLCKPHVAVLMVLILLFLEGSPLVAGIRELNGQYLMGMFLLIPLALSIFHDRTVWVWRVPQVKVLFAIGALFLVSTWWSDFKYPVTLIPQIDMTVQMTRAFVMLLGFLVFCLYFVNTRPRIELMIWVIVALITVTALSAMLPFLEGEELKRARASFGMAENSNRLAYMSIFGASLLWFYHSCGAARWRKCLIFPLLFFLTATAVTAGSRSGFLQLVILGALVVKEQKGWSVTKRIQSIFLVGSVVLVLLVVVPSAPITRIMSYDTEAAEKVTGGESLRTRIATIYALIEMATSNPILGIGLGNFRWMHKTYYGLANTPHNSYLWMLTEGGVGVLALYLVLFRITYRMLRQLETAGPRDLLWLSKGLRVNLILLLVFSIFANAWLEIFPYLIIGLTICMTRVWQDRSQNFTLPARVLAAA